MESQKQERKVKEMKRVTKIIAMASIFSFILSYSSLISSLQQKLHLLSMYTNLVDKKFMFLICNGIVGFILGSFRGNSETIFHGKATRNSETIFHGKATRNSETIFHGKATNIVEQTKEEGIKHMRETEVKKAVAILEEKSVSKEEEEEEHQQRVALVKGGEEVTLVVEDDHEGILVQDLAIIRIDDHDDEEINDSLLSLEDLNKKCEEFIRKMKAEIRLSK